jgi:hypothetical protein
MELIGQLAPVAPQVALVSLDLVVESMDIPQRDELVKRIRQVTGMTDPDADENDPEQIARQQVSAAQQKMQMETAMAELRKLIADAAKSEAQAKELMARISNVNMQTQKTAVEAAGAVAAIPVVADVADHMLHEAGYQSRTEQEETLAAVAQQAAAEQAQAQQQQPAQPAAPAPEANPQASPGLGQ